MDFNQSDGGATRFGTSFGRAAEVPVVAESDSATPRHGERWANPLAHATSRFSRHRHGGALAVSSLGHGAARIPGDGIQGEPDGAVEANE
jgi:hypothetical protein